MSTKPNTVSCDVQFITPIATNIYQVMLKPSRPVVFRAGQYLEIWVDDTPHPYSIASSPHADYLELQIFDDPDNRPASLAAMMSDGQANIQAPCGDCYLPDQIPDDTPILLLAAGTGFAQIKSMAEELLARGITNPVHLYWGNRQPESFYFAGVLEAWDLEHPNFDYHLIAEETGPNWQGREGLVYEAVLADFDVKNPMLMYISGSPGMVHGTLDALVEQGFNRRSAHSDILDMDISHWPKDR